MNVRSELSAAPAGERPSFGVERLARIAELETSHFWFSGRRRLVQQLIERHAPRVTDAVDVGCGTGAFLEILARYADHVVGIDPLADAAGGRVRAGRAERLPLEPGSTDLVVALDVLEHVDDRAALKEFHRVLRPGGWAIVTVPAFPFLWSDRDRVARHERRYRRANLLDLFEASGFTVAQTAYYQFALFPLLVASRIAARRRPGVTVLEEKPVPRLNGALRRVNELEVSLGRRVRWPWGSTLAAAAQKVSE